jgi:hypothetical protein
MRLATAVYSGSSVVLGSTLAAFSTWWRAGSTASLVLLSAASGVVTAALIGLVLDALSRGGSGSRARGDVDHVSPDPPLGGVPR